MVPLTLIERLMALFQNGDMKSVQSKKEQTKDDNSTNLPGEETSPVMLNTLALSSDQETLYLIDNGRAIDFPLNSRNGVLIGTLRGQITVASGKQTPESGNTDGDLPEVIRVTTEKAQWSGFYNEENEVFGLIGVADLDISIAEPKTEIHFVDLKEKVINIKRKGILLELTVFPKEKG